MDHETCRLCRFWDEVEASQARTLGECKRRSPTVCPPSDGTVSTFEHTYFPETEAGDWCGEFYPGRVAA